MQRASVTIKRAAAMPLGAPGMMAVAFAIAVSLWMVAKGSLMVQRAGRIPIAEESDMDAGNGRITATVIGTTRKG